MFEVGLLSMVHVMLDISGSHTVSVSRVYCILGLWEDGVHHFHIHVLCPLHESRAEPRN